VVLLKSLYTASKHGQPEPGTEQCPGSKQCSGPEQRSSAAHSTGSATTSSGSECSADQSGSATRSSGTHRPSTGCSQCKWQHGSENAEPSLGHSSRRNSPLNPTTNLS
jgi:hypothetical protein